MPIKVRLSSNKPHEFHWQARWNFINSIQDYWVDTGEWWQGEGEKMFYRVLSGQRLYEIYYDCKEDSWEMYHIYD